MSVIMREIFLVRIRTRRVLLIGQRALAGARRVKAPKFFWFLVFYHHTSFIK